MILPIFTYPENTDILHIPGEKVRDPKDPKIQKLIDDMIETMHEKEKPGSVNVGLAAQQVGQILQLCILEVSRGEIQVLINPKITSVSRSISREEEGCISVPDTYIPIERHDTIQVRFLDRNGEKQKIKAKGFFARAIQHEMDHLNGILIVDRQKEQKKGNIGLSLPFPSSFDQKTNA